MAESSTETRSATQMIAEAISGAVSAHALVDEMLTRIDKHDRALKAWAHVDPTLARDQAAALDKAREAGRTPGPLHGLPIGLKDIIDTADQPTQLGSEIYEGRQPQEDATVVRRLRAAGAVILGKTVTTEFATMRSAETVNPHDPTRTPGGSSSGSAAAVAAGMVPVALGTQTNGSMIRPASFCGVFGYKPTFGRIPRTGSYETSRTLDQIGVFARSLEDAALVAETLMGPDGRDRYAVGGSGVGLVATLRLEPPVRPKLAFVKTPAWSRAESSTMAAFEELVEALGESVDTVDLPESFEAIFDLHYRVMSTEIALKLGPVLDKAPGKLGDAVSKVIADGRTLSSVDYLHAVDTRITLQNGLAAIFEQYDAIVTPAAIGEAPVGFETTGDPSFCTLWSYCGFPAISLPLMTGSNGLPLGVQAVGRLGDDARLLRTARWIISLLAQEGA